MEENKFDLWIELVRKMDEIMVYQSNHMTSNYEGLQCMKVFMQDIMMPILRKSITEAEIYRRKRDEQNIELFVLLNESLSYLRNVFSDDNQIMIEPMTSLHARLNLIGKDSDIDIGIMCVDLNLQDGNLDQEKYSAISNKLESNGFTYHHTFNEHNSSNRYYSFQKYVRGVEIEVKVRDLKTTETIFALHKHMDNKLTEEEITLFTFAKYQFKELDKENREMKGYVKFKKVLYEYVFSHITGGFVFPDPTIE